MFQLDSDATPWVQWTADAAYAALRPRPLVEPAAQVMAAKRNADWSSEMRHAAAAVFQGGPWTQDRMQLHSLADTDRCQLCGELGSPHHRLHVCPCHRQARAKCPRTYQHIAEQAGAADLLWSRGLTVDPSASWDFRPVSEVDNDIMLRKDESDGGSVTFSGRGAPTVRSCPRRVLEVKPVGPPLSVVRELLKPLR